MPFQTLCLKPFLVAVIVGLQWITEQIQKKLDRRESSLSGPLHRFQVPVISANTKWCNALKKVRMKSKHAPAPSVCREYCELVVEQTDRRVKGCQAWATQKSSDPQNRLWQLGAHFTNCSDLSNYSLVTRSSVSKGNILHCKTNTQHLHSFLHHFLWKKRKKWKRSNFLSRPQ